MASNRAVRSGAATRNSTIGLPVDGLPLTGDDRLTKAGRQDGSLVADESRGEDSSGRRDRITAWLGRQNRLPGRRIRPRRVLDVTSQTHVPSDADTPRAACAYPGQPMADRLSTPSSATPQAQTRS